MIHDTDLLERLSRFGTVSFDGEVFRATRKSLDPLAPSTSGGRWAPKGGAPVLYTSLEREGALAEISFHWGQLTPLPTKPAALHRVRLAARKTLRLIEADLATLGVHVSTYREVNFRRTQEIGAAVAFLECDGLVVPSARWSCQNLVLFMDNHSVANVLDVVATEEVDWLGWARARGLIEPTAPGAS